MKRRHAKKLLLILFVVLSFSEARSTEPSQGASQGVIKLEVPGNQQREPVWLKLLDELAWPVFAVVALVTLRRPLLNLLQKLSEPGAEFALGGLAVKMPLVESKLEEQQKQLDSQSQQIKRLITLSMSWYIYEMLFELSRAKSSSGEYIFRKDGSMDRNLRFLIDHGYLQEVYPMPNDGENIIGKVYMTQAADDLIAMRGSPRRQVTV
jgi:hypothetical protein